MELERAKNQLANAECALKNGKNVLFATFKRDDTELEVWLTPRLYRKAKRGRVWNSKAMLTTLKNASYGFEPTQARSRGGRDGLFVLDRHFKPANTMMSKLFGQFLDHPNHGADELARWLGVDLEQLVPVRMVSHHMRLLGVLSGDKPIRRLVLVDWDSDTS